MEGPPAGVVQASAILQVVAEVQDTQVLRPFVVPGTRLAAGSGVIIDAKHGIVVTNAHVVGNSVNLSVFSSLVSTRLPLKCRLVSIMREKDLALIQVEEEPLKTLHKVVSKPDILNARPVDHLELYQGAPLYAAGYPLGTRHLQVTTGCYSGLSTSDSFMRLTQSEDSMSRDPTYIVTSAGLNYGMSGGGLFDTNGGLVGIITAGIPSASQIGFAIPSRVLLANYTLMLSSINPIPPTFHFRWTNVSNSTWQFLSRGAGKRKNEKLGDGSIMVRHVLPDSIFSGVLQRGDLLRAIEFRIPRVESDSLLLPLEGRPLKSRKQPCIKLFGKVESHGELKLSVVNPEEASLIPSREFSIPEIADYLRPGCKVCIFYIRNGINHEDSLRFGTKPSVSRPLLSDDDTGSVVSLDEVERPYRIPGVYPTIEPLRWIKIDGIVMQNTTLNALAECPRYKYIAEIPYYDDLLFNKSVIITYVEPSSSSGSLSCFNEGDLVVYVDGKEVETVDEVAQHIKDAGSEGKKSIPIESDRGAIALADLEWLEGDGSTISKLELGKDKGEEPCQEKPDDDLKET